MCTFLVYGNNVVELAELEASDPFAQWLARAEVGDISQPIDFDDGLAIVGLVSKVKSDSSIHPGEEADMYEVVRVLFKAYVPREMLEKFVLCLAPFAPHLGEELWERLGHDKSLAYEPWPEYDAKALVESEIEIPVQVLGKLRGRIKVPVAATPAEMEAAAKANADVAKFLEGKTIVKVVAVPKRMVNFVVR